MSVFPQPVLELAKSTACNPHPISDLFVDTGVFADCASEILEVCAFHKGLLVEDYFSKLRWSVEELHSLV